MRYLIAIIVAAAMPALAQPVDLQGQPAALPQVDVQQSHLRGAMIVAQPPQEPDGPSIPNWGGAIKFEDADAPVLPAPAGDRAHYRNPQLPGSFPFSSAVVVGDTIYLSGELGVDYATFKLVDGGVGAETQQIFVNYETTLNALGAALADIVKCTVFLDDMEDYAEMNKAYAAALPDPKPARSTFGVDGLALGAALEIECIAVRAQAVSDD